MPAFEQNGEPRDEAEFVLSMVRQGLETADSARELIRVSPGQARFLTADELWYRQACLAEFENLLEPGSVAPPERPRTRALPPPPAPIENAILEALAELMAKPAPAQIPHPPPSPTEILARVARHYRITLAQLTEHRRGMSPGNGVPRWTAVHLLHEIAGLTYPEIRPLLSYADGQCVYDSTVLLRRRRAKDPLLDRRISELLESVRESTPGPPSQCQANAAELQQPHERHADAPEPPNTESNAASPV